MNLGQAAKLVEKALIRLTKRTDGKRKEISGNQDIPIPLQLVDFGATLHMFQFLIRIDTIRRSGVNTITIPDFLNFTNCFITIKVGGIYHD